MHGCLEGGEGNGDRKEQRRGERGGKEGGVRHEMCEGEEGRGGVLVAVASTKLRTEAALWTATATLW